MKTNWKTLVEKTQATQFVLPPGWDTRDDIARQLGCSPDNVRKLLGPAVKNGTIEFKQMPIWDKELKRVRSVACYREISK